MTGLPAILYSQLLPEHEWEPHALYAAAVLVARSLVECIVRVRQELRIPARTAAARLLTAEVVRIRVVEVWCLVRLLEKQLKQLMWVVVAAGDRFPSQQADAEISQQQLVRPQKEWVVVEALEL